MNKACLAAVTDPDELWHPLKHTAAQGLRDASVKTEFMLTPFWLNFPPKIAKHLDYRNACPEHKVPLVLPDHLHYCDGENEH